MKTLLNLILIALFIPIASVGQIKASFYANVTTGCAPLVVQFTSTSTGSPTSYQWNLGNSSTVSTTNSAPSTTYLTPGTYTVSLTVSNGSGNNTETKTGYIVVRDNPVPNFTGSPLAGCPGTTVSFSNTTVSNGTSATYTWYFGDGGSSNAVNPAYTYNSSGIYKVQLYATNNYGCKKLFERQAYVNIYDKPTINFTANKTDICAAGQSVSFSGSAIGAGPFTYSWKFGDGGTGSGQNTSHTYNGPAPATYNVELEVTDSRGCKNKVIKTGYINLHNNKANFTGPTSVCVGVPVTFTNTSAVPTAIPGWTFGDGGSSSTASPTYTYNTAGTYTVTLTMNKNGCIDQVQKTIIVHPRPNVDFTINPDSPCPAPVTIQFTPNGSYTNYTWTFGDGSPQSTVAAPTHTYMSNDSFVATLAVTDGNGCKDTVDKQVNIFGLIDTIYANKKEGCIPLTITFTANALQPDFTQYPYPGKTFVWDFGDGSGIQTTNIPTVAHTFTNAGVYRVINTLTTINDCVAKDTLYIRVGTKPTPSFTSQLRVCHREAVQFISTTPPPVNNWLWIYGDGNWDTAKASIDHYYIPGNYTVKFVAFYNGCPSDTVYKNIIIDSPDAQFISRTSCHVDSLKHVKFTNKSTGATSWTWYFGDGQSSTVLDPEHNYSANGSYSVKLVAYNINSGCYDTIIRTIKIISPSASITISKAAVCKMETVQFVGTLTGSTPEKYLWTSTNGIKSPLIPTNTCNYQFTDSGIHTVTVSIFDEHDCEHKASTTVMVSSPTPKFGASPLTGCVPFTTSFTDSSRGFRDLVPIVQRIWHMGNGIIYTNNSPVPNTYSTAGIYTVKLVVIDNLGCMDSITKPNYIKAQKPSASFNMNDKGCAGSDIGLSNTSANANNYRWDFGNGDTSVAIQPSYKYAMPGTYTITLIARDGIGCMDTFSKTVTIYKPVALFTLTDSIAVCPPLSVKFEVMSTGIKSQLWNFGGGDFSGLSKPNRLFTTSGKHPVTLTVTDSLGCKDSVTKFVDILGYAGGFTYTPLKGCVPLEVDFTSTLTNVPFVIWDFNDGTTANATSGTTKHIYTFPGIFTPKMIFTDGKGCTSINPGKDPIEVDDAVAHFTTSPLCEYTTVQFKDSSYGYFSDIQVRWWLFHDNKTSGSIDPSHYYGAPGYYNVQLSVINKNGCTDTLKKDIYINPSPQIDAGADTIICVKDSATLYPSGGVSYIWSPASYLSCTHCTNPKAAPQKRFIYSVEGTDANGCKNTDTVEIGTKTKVIAIVGEGGEMCEKEMMVLHVSGADTYEWTPADGLNNNKIPDPVASPHQTTVYTVFSFEGSCIPDTDLVKVVIFPLPTVEARGEQTIIAGNTADIQASGTLITRFAWSPAEDLSCSNCSAPTAKPTKTTTYTVTVYTAHECVDSDKVTITVLCDESQLFIPNTFTPNGDGQNDLFYPRGAGLNEIQSFSIYNRWGELVFERRGIKLNDSGTGWDGTFKGAALPPDVFVYTLFVYCDNGELMKIKGDVTIVR